jgi:hypothetical protein
MRDLDALRKTRIHERQPDLFVGVMGVIALCAIDRGLLVSSLLR